MNSPHFPKLLMPTGIYQIKNLVNGKIYIGSSKKMNKRWCVHRTCLKHNRHENKHLQSAWNKYGEKSFEFSVLLYCPQVYLIATEDYMIELHSSRNPKVGYNLGPALPWLGKKHTEETKAKIRAAQPFVKHPACTDANRQALRMTGTAVEQISSGLVVSTFPSIRAAAESIVKDKTSIRECILGKRQEAYGFTWRAK